MTISGDYRFAERSARFRRATLAHLADAELRVVARVGNHLETLIESSPRRVETGAYLQSWRDAFASAAQQVTPNGPVVEVVPDSAYGPYIEHGTASVPAAMHLPRARLAAADEARAITERALNTAWKEG